MFIKITKSKNHQYVQLVESYRENGKTKHKTLLNLGRLEEVQNNPIIRRLLKRLSELSLASEGSDLFSASEARIVNWGYLVYQKLWDRFELPELLKKLVAKRKVQFNFNDACFLMTVQHLLNPKSKRGAFLGQGEYLNLPEVDLNHLYRSLDLLCEEKSALEEALFARNFNRSNMRVDVAFYESTTFSFKNVKAGSFLDFGFSKNGEFNEVQVVMGLLLDCEGRPIGYELFPDSTLDCQAMETVLELMKKRFNIRRVVVDRVLNDKLNLKRIRDLGYGYIVASSIRKLGKPVQDQILSSEGYLTTEEGFRFKTFSYLNRFKDEDGQTYDLNETLIVTYSEERAIKARADRKLLIDKAVSLLSSQGLVNADFKRDGRKYLKAASATNKISGAPSESAIENDSRFDGYYVIQTSENTAEVIEAYHHLWKIEESFQMMKSGIEAQPVFHWTESRIKGHFLICFLALLLERTLETKLRKAQCPVSPELIREALNSMCFVEIEFEGEKYLVKKRTVGLSKAILRALRISPPKKVLPVNEFKL